MDRERFREEAARRGIAAESADAMYDDLYGADESKLVRANTPFQDQSGLSRTVEVLIWVGTFALISAHAWWCREAYYTYGVGIVLLLTLLWQAGFLAAAEWANRRGYHLLVDVFAAIVALYAPLAIYSFERLLGFSFGRHDFDGFAPYVSGGWLFMEVASIVGAALLLFRYRRAFLMAPLSLLTSFLVVDGAARAFGGWDDRQTVNNVVLAGGVVILAVATMLDYRGWRRFAFWPHLAAMCLIVSGLELICDGRNTLALFVSAAIALLLGVWLARAGYLAAGGLLGWVALSISAHGPLFPLLLMVGGVGFIACALWLARVDSPARRWLAARTLPAPQRDLGY